MNPAPVSGRYHVWTIGCQMNEADSRQLASLLEHAGWRPCETPEGADLVILNTCVVRQQAEDRVYRRLTYVGQMKKRRPGLKVALMGCLVGVRAASAEAERARARFPFVDFWVPPSDPASLIRALRAGDEDRRALDREVVAEEGWIRGGCAPAAGGKPVPAPAGDPGAIVARVPVVLGCSHACSYCIIPYRRGGERSRPAEDVLDEARRLVAGGAREIVLLGQIVDRYGLDLPGGPDLAALLERVSEIDGLSRVRFLTSHPNYLRARLIETVAAHPRICPQFEVPVQAGDDAVLARMKRGYTVDDYRALVARIRSVLPDAAIHTDVIVGFPGETEEQFLGSVRLLEELRLDKAHLARYSERPQTFAARRYPDDVPEPEKDRRARFLDEVQCRIQGEKNAALLGRTVEALVEGRDEKRGRWRGRDRHDHLVFFEDPSASPGRLVRVRVEHATPFVLIGVPA